MVVGATTTPEPFMTPSTDETTGPGHPPSPNGGTKPASGSPGGCGVAPASTAPPEGNTDAGSDVMGANDGWNPPQPPPYPPGICVWMLVTLSFWYDATRVPAGPATARHATCEAVPGCGGRASRRAMVPPAPMRSTCAQRSSVID